MEWTVVSKNKKTGEVKKEVCKSRAHAEDRRREILGNLVGDGYTYDDTDLWDIYIEKSESLKKFSCSMQKKKESLAKKSEDVSIDTARQFAQAHADSILDTLAEICAQTADAAIQDTKDTPDPDEVIKDDAHYAFKDYEQTLKELAINLAVKFAKSQLKA